MLPVFARVNPRLPNGSVDPAAVTRLAAIAKRVRLRDAQMIAAAGLGHIGGDFSVIDILVTLYFAVLNFDPSHPLAEHRDRLILSKGHASGALYATFASLGLIEEEALETFMAPLSNLSGHPANTKITGVEASTGPLGHGLPVGVGMALAAAHQSSSQRTFVIVGDGELEEGSNWEAMMVAAHYHLTNLTVVVDRNGLQQGATTAATTALEPLGAKAAAFGFDVVEVNGHDFSGLIEALTNTGAKQSPGTAEGRPSFVIAETTKGYPISFMSGQVAWHHKVPSQADLAQIMVELGV